MQTRIQTKVNAFGFTVPAINFVKGTTNIGNKDLEELPLYEVLGVPCHELAGYFDVHRGDGDYSVHDIALETGLNFR